MLTIAKKGKTYFITKDGYNYSITVEKLKISNYWFEELELSVLINEI